MNTLYKIANLMDGEYDGQQIRFDKRRRYFNYFVEYTGYFFVLSHIYVFIYHERKYALVYYKIHDGAGDRVVNFLIGWTIFSLALVIPVYRRLTKHPDTMRLISFLWCYDEREMQERYFLDQEAARKQIRTQRLGLRYATIWHRYFVFCIALFITKFAVENPTFRIENGIIWFCIKLVLYLLLFLIEQSQLLRVFLIFNELNLSCTYLANHLRTLMRRLRRLASQSVQLPVRQLIVEVLCEYNGILKKQRQLNGHFEQTFYFYFTFNSFSIIYPCVILYETNYALILVNFLNYFITLFAIFFPVIHFNSHYLIDSNMKFVRTCFHLAGQTKCPKLKLKLLQISELNPNRESISFHFHHFLHYSMSLFVAWVVESLSLALMANRAF